MNYNISQPDKRGLWFNATVTRSTRRSNTSSMKLLVLGHWVLGAGAKIHFKLDFLLRYLCALPGSLSYLVIKAKL